MPAHFLGSCSLVCALLALPLAAQHSKQVAAPPADILSGRVRLPQPRALATASHTAVLPVEFVATAAGWRAEVEFEVEAGSPAAFAWLAPENWEAQVSLESDSTSPRALEAWLDERGGERRGAWLEQDLAGWLVERVDAPWMEAGTWHATIDVERGSRSMPPSEGWWIVRGSTDYVLETWVDTHQTLADAPVAVLVQAPHAGATERAELILSRGSDVRVQGLRDDSTQHDGAAGDGLWGGLLPAGLSGDWRARIDWVGRTEQGARTVRTAQLFVPLVERAGLLDGSVHVALLEDRRIELALGAELFGRPAKVHLSTEVWGRDARGEALPICWLSKILEPERSDTGWRLPLALDPRWIALAQARPPFELRRLRWQDPDSHVVIDGLDRLEFEFSGAWSPASTPPGGITREMLMGPLAPPTFVGTPGNVGGSKLVSPFLRALLLTHGYCSGGNVWPAADFTQPKLAFLDPDANRTHDQFALLMLQQTAGYGSYGVVAHSQGGMAALHLFTYYSSGLDHAVGPRLIQSVGSPYQGTPLASWGGFACGVNNDMTPAGAATWLAGIPSWARSEVFYWTTSNSGSACNFFTNLLLTDPEDGTTEQFRGQLPGGNSMGHVIGWCHTTGMSNPAQYTDPSRNAQMDANAAR